MEVRGIELSPKIVVVHLRDLTEPEIVYKRAHLVEMVREQHEEMGGIFSDADVTAQVKKALQTLKAKGIAENPRQDAWRLNFDGMATEREQEIKAQSDAEISVGTGDQAVYGWYLPAYRHLAERDGAEHFEMKIGRTVNDPVSRVGTTANHAPERYRMGFLLKDDDSSSWESILHAVLTLMGRKVDGAAGDEWFRTNPEELHSLWQALHDAIHGLSQ